MIEPETHRRYERASEEMISRASNEDPEGYAAILQIARRTVTELLGTGLLALNEQGYSGDAIVNATGLGRANVYRLLVIARRRKDQPFI